MPRTAKRPRLVVDDVAAGGGAVSGNGGGMPSGCTLPATLTATEYEHWKVLMERPYQEADDKDPLFGSRFRVMVLS
ncbi:MAG: hypothetical protein FWC46_02500 [Actinomycetia bacterium]|nr:hypothetical protein [Actinomycetes bacterium]